MKKLLYFWAVKKANQHANRTEGLFQCSWWDEFAALLWKEEFED